MKKLMTMLLGLSMVLGTATAFGATKKAGTKKSGTKAPARAKKTAAEKK
jgi:hypothetical protein